MTRIGEPSPAEIGTRPSSSLASPAILSLALFAATLAFYMPALNNTFVNYDDPAYVTANAHVLRGLSWNNLAWAFTSTAEANWHPLTWISHMLDVEMFGTNPRGHHFVNVLFHALNVVLLFFILRKATPCLWRSFVVAALFAVHPLNVECVAWVAERKSLLSMLFLLLALAAYGWYSNRRSYLRYVVVVLLFMAGLAAKPMVITLPVLLLLWDYWPLARISHQPEESRGGLGLIWLVAEKIPLFALSAASAWITLYSQRVGGALGSSELLPLGLRVKNAVYSYVSYIEKGIWPSHLAVFYPHPEGSLQTWRVLLAALLIVGASALAWLYRDKRPYLFTGWFWYLIAMVPMIGVVQVGRQAMADRYAYLPFVGLFIVAVWSGADLLERLKLSTFARGAISAAPLIVYGSLAFLQISYWHDSYTLFSHTLAVTSRNGIAEDNLGSALVQLGRPDLALPHFEAAAKFIPQLSTAHYNLGVLQQQQGHTEQARNEYELTLKYSTDATEIAQAHSNLGFLLMGMNDLKASQAEFTAALQVYPDKQNSLLGRGMVEYREGNLDGAVRDLTHAAQIGPSAAADFWLGRALEDKGQPQAASLAYQAALQLAPNMTEAQQRLDALRVK
jgi:Tfp pilus assembly protein PilF